MDLTAQRITAGYGKRTVLSDLNVALPTGGFSAIVGPNGSGKSTLLKVLGRLLKPSAGRVVADGHDLRRLTGKETARLLAVLPQHPTAPEGLTVRELVSHGRYPHVKRLGTLGETDRQIVTRALKDCELESLADRPVAALSGGERQRAWIAMAVAQRPRVLLLDEPLNALDINHQLEVMELLARLNREEGLTIGLVIHDLNLAARFCSRVVLMHQGAVVSIGEPHEVLASQAVRDVFQVRIHMNEDPLTGRPVCHFYRAS